MAKEVQTLTASCPTHGPVLATREMPGSGFPWVVNGVRRWLAKREPYRCPTCKQPVTG
jgi:hypothetical protein